MADNVTLDPGTGGAVLATDDISSVHYPRTKVGYGVDGSYTDVSDTNPLPVDDAGGSLTVDHTVLDNAHSEDFDSGAGTDTTMAVGIAVPASGGAVVVPGDATAGLKVDLGADNDVTVSGTATVTDDGSFTLAANSGTDIGDVTINNAAGASAVNIQDGGNSITVDGTVTADAGTGPWPVTDNGGSLTVDNAALSVTGNGTASGALRVSVASDTTGVLSVDDNGGSLTVDGTVTADAGTGPWPVTDNGGSLTVDNSHLTSLGGAVSGSEVQVDVVAALPAGTNNIGDVDIASALPAGSNLVGDVGVGVRTSGGTTIFRSIDLDESEEEVKATAGQVYWIHATNTHTAPLYLKFYNLTAASTTVGTSTPVLTFLVPSQGDANGAGFVLSIPNGIAFSTAITVAATTGVADSDTGAPGANVCIVNLGYA